MLIDHEPDWLGGPRPEKSMGRAKSIQGYTEFNISNTPVRPTGAFQLE